VAVEREYRNNKNNLEATNGGDEGNPNVESQPGRKVENVLRKCGDSNSNHFIEELKNARRSTTHRKRMW
jgi:hypothetical protein